MGNSRRKGTPKTVVERVLTICDTFARTGTASLTEISLATGLPVSTTKRLLETMRDGGAVLRDSEPRYRIGPRLANLTPSAEAHE
jgi:DNA-binding IclR family transcriptional regulator